MTVVIAALFVWSAIAPYSRGVWYVEITTAAVPLAIFVFFVAQFQIFHNFLCYFRVWEIMQIVGAHYTFELVPFGFGLRLNRSVAQPLRQDCALYGRREFLSCGGIHLQEGCNERRRGVGVFRADCDYGFCESLGAHRMDLCGD